MPGRLQPFPAPRVGESGGSVNAALRSARRAAGISLDVVASRTNFSKPYLSNVEAGRRRVTREIAEAYDQALGTGGLLTRLLTGTPDIPVGREPQLAEVHRLVDRLATGQGCTLLVEGEPGIGKSALLSAGLADADRLGCRVLRAAADESLARFPLWALLEAVRAHGSDADPELSEITALLTGTGTTGVGPGDAVAAAGERLVLLVERWCAGSPVLLVLDDLQWADELSLSVWSRLARLAAQLPLLVAGACRPVPRRTELDALRRGLAKSAGVVLGLGPLPRAAVGELTTRFAGAPAGPGLLAAVDQAGGNPLYLREMVESLVRERRVTVERGRAELTGPAVPRSLAAAIGTRLDFLSEPARTVLRLAALLGPAPRVAELGAVTGRPATDLAAALDEAVTAGVITTAGPVTTVTDRIVFRHGLIRAALYEQTPPALRTALHAEAARALAATGAPVEQVAEHVLAGGTGDWAAAWLVGGAGTALVHRAPRVAVELLDRVLDRLPDDHPHRAAVLAHRVAGLSRLGRDEDVARLGPIALAGIADPVPADPVLAGHTAWLTVYSLGRSGRKADARALVRRLREGGGLDPVWRARLLALDALVTSALPDGHRALAEAEAVGDPLATGYALHAMAVAYAWGEHDDAAASACTRRALAVIGDRPETADLRGLLLTNRAVDLHSAGRLAELPRALGEALAAAERAGTVPRLVALRTTAADMYFDAGRWGDALAEFGAATELVDPGANRGWRYGTAALVAVHRDDRDALAGIERAVGALELPSPDGERVGGRLRLARALAAEASGGAGAVDAVLTATLRPGSTPLDPVPEDNSRSFVPTVVRIALAYGREEPARAYTRAVAAYARERPSPERTATLAHCEGLLAADPQLVVRAAEGYERAGFVLLHAQASENRAVLLAERGELDAAREAYDVAAQGYVGLGAAFDLRRAAARLRPLGVRPSRHRIPNRPTSGWAALTPTERTVAGHVADGLSNPDIADRLHVSRRTVETHVAHILAKLGARSRAEVSRSVRDESQ